MATAAGDPGLDVDRRLPYGAPMMYRTGVWSAVVVAAAAMGMAASGCGDDAERGGPPGEIWVEAPAEAVTGEDGAEVVVQVSLSRRPANRVSLEVSTDAPDEAAPVSAQLVFEAGEVGPKPVVVKGIDDDEVDGAREYQLRFGAARSEDRKFAGAVARAISLRNLDDDLLESELKVTTTFHGSGVVTSSPAGISCPGTCTARFPTGTEVTLTAVASSGSALGGWFGETSLSFGETFRVPLTNPTYQVIAGFVLDEVARLIGIDGPVVEHFDAAAAGGGRIFAGGDIEGPTTIGGQALAHGGGKDPALATFNASTGALVWARALGGSGDGHVTTVIRLASGDVIFGGWFTGQLDLFGDVVTATGTGSFLVRLDAAGAPIWGRHLTGGPDQGVSEVLESPDGSFLVCGAGAAPLGWFDGAGNIIASTQPQLMTSCSAISPRTGGFYATGNGAEARRVKVSRVSLDHSATPSSEVITGDLPVLVDDALTLASGALVMSLTLQAAAAHQVMLVRVELDGSIVTQTAGTTFFFARSGSLVEENGQLLLARRTDMTELVVERRHLTTMARTACFELDHPVVDNFQLARAGGQSFLVGDSSSLRPFPGRPLELQGGFGGFIAELKLGAMGSCPP